MTSSISAQLQNLGIWEHSGHGVAILFLFFSPLINAEFQQMLMSHLDGNSGQLIRVTWAEGGATGVKTAEIMKTYEQVCISSVGPE